jgi:hypothetical protein
MFFLKFCQSRHFEFAFELDHDHEIKNQLNIQENHLLFTRACKSGQLQLAQQLYNIGEIDIFMKNEDDIFYKACSFGQLDDVCKWLYNLGNLNVHAFQECTRLSHLHVSKWLLLTLKSIQRLYQEFPPKDYFELV